MDFAIKLNRFLTRDRVIIYLLGATVACLIIVGGALLSIVGNILIPIILVTLSVCTIQWYVLKQVNSETTESIEAISALCLTKTQRYIFDQPQSETSLAITLMACRHRDKQRLYEILINMSEDFGNDYLCHWLLNSVQDELEEKESYWLWKTLSS